MGMTAAVDLVAQRAQQLAVLHRLSPEQFPELGVGSDAEFAAAAVVAKLQVADPTQLIDRRMPDLDPSEPTDALRSAP